MINKKWIWGWEILKCEENKLQVEEADMLPTAL